MDIVVIGAGIVGLSTAWQLRKDGHRVTVIDRGTEIGGGTSFANGGQLSYRYVAPLADPDVLAKIPAWMLRADAPVRFRPRFDPQQWRWLTSFLLACNARDKLHSVASLLPLSLLSRALIHDLAEDEGVEFDHERSGKLIVHRDSATFDSARRLIESSAELAEEQQALDEAGCLALEPALASLRGAIAGGIYTASEEAGDCFKLCLALAQRLQDGANPVRFALGEAVTGFDLRHGQLHAVRTAGGAIPCDGCVVANGAGAATLLRPLGIRLPIYPVKGYSLSLPVRDAAAVPATSVTDFQRKIVYARLGNQLRVAGMADIVGHDETLAEDRLGTLKRETLSLFGHGVDAAQAVPWSGLRPATPTGRPIIGASGIDGIWLNTGHGALGFTLATGSAALVADRIAGRAPSVPDEAFAVTASAPLGWRHRAAA